MIDFEHVGVPRFFASISLYNINSDFSFELRKPIDRPPTRKFMRWDGREYSWSSLEVATRVRNNFSRVAKKKNHCLTITIDLT
jgi:hypothetical protein